MKEYKIIRSSITKKDSDLEKTLNQLGRDGWGVRSTSFNNTGRFVKFLLERDKNRMS